MPDWEYGYQDLPLYFILDNAPQINHLVSLSVSDKTYLRLNWHNAESFKGIPESQNSVKFISADGSVLDSFSLKIKQPKLDFYDQHKGNELLSDNDKPNLQPTEYNANAGYLKLGLTAPEFSEANVKSTLSGNNLSNPLSILNKSYRFGYRLTSDAGILPGGTHNSDLYGTIPTVVEGRYVFPNGAGGRRSIYSTSEADNLSLEQLNEMVNPNVSEVLYSVQSNHEILYVVNLTPDAFKMPHSSTNFYDNSSAIGASNNMKANAEQSADAYHKVFSDLPVYCDLWSVFKWVDPTSVAHTNMQLYDLSNGNPVLLYSHAGVYTPGNASVKGQSTVKLHIINSSNGAELSQVKSFTDWPNQSKHASLTIPSITGYQVVTTDPASVLSRLKLSGEAITGNENVDYPAENTIKDYYVVMEPKTENATVNIVDENEGNKVLASGQVSGKFNSVINSNDDIDGKLKQLLDSGLYDLDQNGLVNGAVYKNGNNVVTVSLKHHIDSTERHYRVIEDRPDGKTKVLVDMTVTLYKDANGSHWYWNGAMKDDVWNGVLLKPSVYTDLIGTRHDANDGSWVFGSYDRFIGYHPVLDSDQIWHDDGVRVYFEGDRFVTLDLFNGQVGVTDMKPSCDFHVSYVKNYYPVTISYYDLSGKLVSTSSKNYEYLDTVDVQGQAPEGYILLAGQATTVKVGADTNEVDLLVTPKMKIERETRQSKRLIDVENRDGSVTTVVQRIIWQRDVTENMVSGEKITGEWHSVGADTMAAWSAPVIDGYVTPHVNALKATPETGEVTVLLKYILKVDSNKPHYLDVNGVGYDTLPAGYEVVSGQDTSKDGLLILKKPQNIQPAPIQYVTRTVTVIMPNGRKRYIRQKARKGTKFLKVHLPRLRGYAMTIADGSVDVMAADSDQSVTVVFAK